MNRIRFRRALIATSVTGVAMMSGLGMASSASATQFNWFGGYLGPNATDGGDSRPNLRISAAGADMPSHKIQVAAHYPGGWSLYGGWVDAWGGACHSYAGTVEAGGMINNPHTVGQNPAGAFIRYNESGTC